MGHISIAFLPEPQETSFLPSGLHRNDHVPVKPSHDHIAERLHTQLGGYSNHSECVGHTHKPVPTAGLAGPVPNCQPSCVAKNSS
ncbi:hypothetical protein Pelo_6448 [Pelomyxa schiedti]|nr:hypothetical protein Pelo_6448 [Pelomyxa schiedti]